MHVAINALFWDNPTVGSGQYLKYLVPALLEIAADLEITLVSCKPLTISSEQQKHGPSDRLKTFVAPTIFRDQESNLAKVWFEQITFPRVCRYLQVEVAHVPYFGSPLYPTDPTVVTIHDIIPVVLPAYRGPMKVRFYTALVSAAARQANLIMTDSDASRRDVLKRLSAEAYRVETVYLAPAPHYQANKTDADDDIRQRYNLPEQFILYIGGYDVRKNVIGLLSAYAQLPETTRQQYPLVLAGGLPKNPSDFFPDPLAMAQTLNLTEQVLTPGWIAEADLPALYRAATIFVYPSMYEGFGLPVLEAMACGTPVITTTSASLPELVGQAALTVQFDDLAGLANALSTLCDNPNQRNELTQQGFEQVKQFTWAKTANQTLQAYRKVLPASAEA